jgi:hypothetical protein
MAVMAIFSLKSVKEGWWAILDEDIGAGLATCAGRSARATSAIASRMMSTTTEGAVTIGV